jgi:hypothetical protein
VHLIQCGVGGRDHLYNIFLKTELIDCIRDEVYVVNEILLMKNNNQLQCVLYVLCLQIVQRHHCVRGGLHPDYTLHNQAIWNIHAVHRLPGALNLSILL